MQYLVATAEEGQMTRAAHRLHVAQPALSHGIAQLECQLEVKLLERHSHGVTLTAAGEAFIAKARVALEAVTEAEQAAHSRQAVGSGVIEFGFLGVPPAFDSPRLLEDFSEAHPNIELRFRELPFPSLPTASWLAEVDVAVCHAPHQGPDIWRQVFRREERAVLAPRQHPLAKRNQLELADVLDQTFVGLHPSLEPTWAGFWSLDDHRGAPPELHTPDRADNPQEVLAALSVRHAITTVPASVARVLSNSLTGVVAITLRDADPCKIMVVGHEDGRNPHVAVLREFASHLAVADASADPVVGQ
jgi:DNA-binding transcriptional LysR family regulator